MSNFYRKKSSAVAAFIKDKSFYIIVLASILMICLAGYMAIRLDNPTTKNESPKVDATDKPYDGEIPEWKSLEPKPVDKNESNISSGTADAEDVKIPPAIVLEYSHPIENVAIAQDFSGSTPVFSETLQDWRLHQGLDYITEGEEDVFAVADGIVEDVYSDGLMGNTVVIAHADGVKTIYQSLAINPRALKGSEILKGDKVGKTGDTATSEVSQLTHLHFAAIKNGAYIDPKELFAAKG